MIIGDCPDIQGLISEILGEGKACERFGAHIDSPHSYLSIMWVCLKVVVTLWWQSNIEWENAPKILFHSNLILFYGIFIAIDHKGVLKAILSLKNMV